MDIHVNCTHRWSNDKSLNSAKWGNFVRVGGLVGGLRDTATNCYTGGSITVSNDTLVERILRNDTTNQSFQALDSTQGIKWSKERDSGGNNRNPATYIYIGGVGGSGFSANFMNFTGQDSSSNDGVPRFVNCYTYITFPAMEVRSPAYRSSAVQQTAITIRTPSLKIATTCKALRTALTFPAYQSVQIRAKRRFTICWSMTKTAIVLPIGRRCSTAICPSWKVICGKPKIRIMITISMA